VADGTAERIDWMDGTWLEEEVRKLGGDGRALRKRRNRKKGGGGEATKERRGEAGGLHRGIDWARCRAARLRTAPEGER
jgi:hypothetical protein